MIDEANQLSDKLNKSRVLVLEMLANCKLQSSYLHQNKPACFTAAVMRKHTVILARHCREISKRTNLDDFERNLETNWPLSNVLHSCGQ